jgi:hypothetical protein
MREPEFDGESYETERDFDRLHSQYQRVWNVMKDSKWRTLYQIHVAINGLGTEAAISARLRDFRKEKFGNHTVNRRYLHDGLFEYQLIPNVKPVQLELYQEMKKRAGEQPALSTTKYAHELPQH